MAPEAGGLRCAWALAPPWQFLIRLCHAGTSGVPESWAQALLKLCNHLRCPASPMVTLPQSLVPATPTPEVQTLKSTQEWIPGISVQHVENELSFLSSVITLFLLGIPSATTPNYPNQKARHDPTPLPLPSAHLKLVTKSC